MEHFFHTFLHYAREVIPALAVGFGISGLVHEFVPGDLVARHLGARGVRPILAAAFIGTLLPVCCWGSLPIAVSFHKKGARLGPVLAFLVATPATSVSALLVAYSVIGLSFTAYIFCAVIVMGLVIGLVGNLFPVQPKPAGQTACPHCAADPAHEATHKTKAVRERIVAALRFAYIKMPREIGRELLVGLILAAAVATFIPVRRLISLYLGGWFGYIFAVVFGILMYLCSTASVPLVDSLVSQGMNAGAGMTLLLVGPVTSYGTLLVLRKEYGLRVVAVFLAALVALSVMLGVGYGALAGGRG